MTTTQLLDLARTATAETAIIDFKRQFDSSQRGDWCELIKDIIAMANSGGGCVVLGCDDDGIRTDWRPNEFRKLDPAQVADQLNKYVDGCANVAAIHWIARSSDEVPAIVVEDVGIPRVFLSPGSYENPPGRAKTAFTKGAIYFRHGAKSEPAEQMDLTYAMERCIEQVREKWLGNIRRVMEAPPGSQIQVVSAGAPVTSSTGAMPVRIVDDPSAPPFGILNPDDTHPHRQKDVVALVNERLRTRAVSAFDIQCVRKSMAKHGLQRQYFHRSKFGGPQYSEEFIDYMIDEYTTDPAFFALARVAAKDTPAV